MEETSVTTQHRDSNSGAHRSRLAVIMEMIWKSENDPQNPQDWSTGKKTVNLCIVTVLAFLASLASSMIVPGVPLLAEDYHESRDPVKSLSVSIFILGFAFGPLLLSPLSELYGRRIIYNICNIFGLGLTIACALAPNIASFIVFRFLAGCFAGGPLNIAGGSVSDLVPMHKRGAVMSILLSGVFLAPSIGPVAGGFIAQYIGWRMVFWVLTAANGVMTLLTFLFLSESYAPVMLNHPAQVLSMAHSNTEKSQTKSQNVIFRAVSMPVKMLVRSPIIAGLSLYLALVYGYLYLLFTTFSTVFPVQYGFDTGILGLAFLGLGTGIAISLIVLAWVSDWLQISLTQKRGVSKPEFRLVPLVFGIPFLPIGLFVYGWTVEYKVHWIVPIIFTGFTGVGLIFSFVPTQIYLVDAFTPYAASALAASSVVRSICGACLPIAGLPMYTSLGYGWGNSLLGFIALVVSIAPLIFWRYGETLRMKSGDLFE